jgi:hydrogenase maturation protease
MTDRVLVAGVGNIFLGDDGFGVAVASRVAGEELPDGVKVRDFGIASVHLAYELLEGYESLVLIDAVGRGDPPGTLSVLEPALDPAPPSGEIRLGAMDAHGMHPEAVLDMVTNLGGQVGKVLVVGCEPAFVEEHLGLSDEVAGAVDQAVKMVLDLVAELSRSNRKEGSS